VCGIVMANKEVEKKCKFCKGVIDFKQRYVLLGTYEEIQTIGEDYFHIQCFSTWFNERVKNKAVEIIQDMQKKAMGLVGNIQVVMGNFQGLDQLSSMISTDLEPVKSHFIKKTKKENGNGNKRK